ncbi:hypothetical protein EVAR_60717_1 [Eumeta japonica]|uniref:Uncharacterized protein n=1 Tax=Eumeta variegata TaxID=151549 RepID=A0A4C1Z8K3_EUMVA|nr:hypothetical protein EVAR_60717_1 [Eumeta japonica]
MSVLAISSSKSLAIISKKFSACCNRRYAKPNSRLHAEITPAPFCTCSVLRPCAMRREQLHRCRLFSSSFGQFLGSHLELSSRFLIIIVFLRSACRSPPLTRAVTTDGHFRFRPDGAVAVFQTRVRRARRRPPTPGGSPPRFISKADALALRAQTQEAVRAAVSRAPGRKRILGAPIAGRAGARPHRNTHFRRRRQIRCPIASVAFSTPLLVGRGIERRGGGRRAGRLKPS